MNYWEIGSALESAAKTIKDFPGSIIERATDDVETQYKSMVKAVTDAQAFSQKCITELRDLDKIHADECERIYKDITERRSKLKKCLSEVRYEDVRRVEELATAIQKLRSIDPADLDVLIEVISRRGGTS